MNGAYFVYYDGSKIRAIKTATDKAMLKTFEDVESEINLETSGVNGVDWAGGFSSQVSSPIHAVKEVISMFWRYEKRLVQDNREISEIFQLKVGTKYDGEDGTLEYLGNGECTLILRPSRDPLAGPPAISPRI